MASTAAAPWTADEIQRQADAARSMIGYISEFIGHVEDGTLDKWEKDELLRGGCRYDGNSYLAEANICSFVKNN